MRTAFLCRAPTVELIDKSMGFFDFFSRDKKQNLDRGLQKTKEGVFGKLRRALAGRRTIDDDFLDELEEISSDVGAETTLKIIERIQARAARDKYVGEDELNAMLCEEITALLAESPSEDNSGRFAVPSGHKPYVIMVVGVNGVGKTTTIGKLAHQYKSAGYKVMLGAADTFRTARRVGTPRGSACCEAAVRVGRSGSGIRHTVVGSGQRHRRGHNRYRGPSS